MQQDLPKYGKTDYPVCPECGRVCAEENKVRDRGTKRLVCVKYRHKMDGPMNGDVHTVEKPLTIIGRIMQKCRRWIRE